MKNRKLTFKPEMEQIIKKCDVCSLGMVDSNNEPYVLPMNFGYAEDTVYLHSAREGRKIDILRNNPRVCISFSTDHDLYFVNEEVGCSWGMKYRSILVYGKVEMIDDYDERVEALEHIMANYSDRDFKFNKPAVLDVQPFKVKVEKMEGRVLGY